MASPHNPTQVHNEPNYFTNELYMNLLSDIYVNESILHDLLIMLSKWLLNEILASSQYNDYKSKLSQSR